jgi:hypothetical protein
MGFDQKPHGIGFRPGRAFTRSASISVMAAAAELIGRNDFSKVASALASAGITQFGKKERAGHASTL